MSRMWSLVFVAAVACGGPKPHATSVPLPPDKPAEPATPAVADQPKAPAPPAEPPKPAGPYEVTVPANKVTVKLVSPGKGKREPLRYSTKAGDKQSVELAMDFAAKQTETRVSKEGVKEAPHSEDQIMPTMVFAGTAETKSLDKDGNAAYVLTVSSTDARQATGSNIDVSKFKDVLASVAGLVISSTLNTNGTGGDVLLHIDKPTDLAAATLELVKMTLPQFPVLPTEPVAVGAKWQTTTSTKIRDKLEVTQVTNYELVAHKGATWTIKGTTKVSGTDQDVEDGAKVSQIKGTGTTEGTLADGALYPTTKSTVETAFTVTDKDKAEIQFAFKIGGALTPAK